MKATLRMVSSGKVLDTVTVAADGRVDYTTGRAEPIVRSLRNLAGDEWLTALADWSNGYLEMHADGAVTAADAFRFDPGQPRDREGRWTDGAGAGGGDWNLSGPDGPVTFPGSTTPARAGREAFDSAARPDRGIETERAVRSYSGGMADTWNPAFRQGRAHAIPGPELKKIGLIDEAIEANQLENDVVVWRGLRKAHRMFTPEQLAGSLVGAEWRERGNTSTTADPAVAEGFANFTPDVMDGGGPLLIRMLAPKGTNAIQVGDYRYEAEILFGRDTYARVVADHGIDANGLRRVDALITYSDPTPLPEVS